MTIKTCGTAGGVVYTVQAEFSAYNTFVVGIEWTECANISGFHVESKIFEALNKILWIQSCVEAGVGILLSCSIDASSSPAGAFELRVCLNSR